MRTQKHRVLNGLNAKSMYVYFIYVIDWSFKIIFNRYRFFSIGKV